MAVVPKPVREYSKIGVGDPKGVGGRARGVIKHPATNTLSAIGSREVMVSEEVRTVWALI